MTFQMSNPVVYKYSVVRRLDTLKQSEILFLEFFQEKWVENITVNIVINVLKTMQIFVKSISKVYRIKRHEMSTMHTSKV